MKLLFPLAIAVAAAHEGSEAGGRNGNKPLTYLDLQGGRVGDTGAQGLGKGLKMNHFMGGSEGLAPSPECRELFHSLCDDSEDKRKCAEDNRDALRAKGCRPPGGHHHAGEPFFSPECRELFHSLCDDSEDKRKCVEENREALKSKRCEGGPHGSHGVISKAKHLLKQSLEHISSFFFHLFHRTKKSNDSTMENIGHGRPGSLRAWSGSPPDGRRGGHDNKRKGGECKGIIDSTCSCTSVDGKKECMKSCFEDEVKRQVLEEAGCKLPEVSAVAQSMNVG